MMLWIAAGIVALAGAFVLALLLSGIERRRGLRTSCPVCGAAPGKPCTMLDEPVERITPHPGRSEAA